MRVKKYLILTVFLVITVFLPIEAEEKESNSRTQVLLEQLYSSDRNVQVRAARELKYYSTPKVINALSGVALNKNFDSVVRRVALRSLGDIADPMAVPTVLSIIDSSEVNLKVEAMGAAVNFSTPTLHKKILENTGADNPLVRQKAILYLSRIEKLPDGFELKEVLLSKLKDIHVGVRKNTVKVIEKQNIEELIPSLGVWLEEENSEIVRIQIVKSLGVLGGEAVHEILRKALLDSSPIVRITAALSLAELGSRAGLNEATTAIKSADAPIRVKACRVMGLVGSDNIIFFLEQAVQDYDTRVQRAARQALNKVKVRLKERDNKYKE